MIKEIIKCDYCGKELQETEDGIYFDIIRKNIPGYTFYTGSIKDFENKKQICKKCLKDHKLNW